MTVLKSQIQTQSEEFKKNSKRNFSLVEELRSYVSSLKEGVGQEAKKKHQKKGKLFVRDRLLQLLDPDTAFLELSPLAGLHVEEKTPLGGGILTGIGVIHGHKTVIVAHDATIKGGTYFPITVKKHLRALEIALENHLPCIYLVDSGGIYLPLQSQVFADRDHFGRIFYLQAQLSAQKIPQIAVVLGSCTAGGAYVPAMADQTIMVQHQSSLFLAGPPLVEAATGEKVTEEELGGADLHCRVSGVADYLTKTEEEALALARRLLTQSIPRPKKTPLPASSIEEPLYPAEELAGVLPTHSKYPLDSREVIARLVDGSRFEEFKALYGTTLLCGFSHLWGHPIGILANQGVLFSESALKGVHFIQLCTQRRIPLLFLQNITGFMVGRKFEAGGITKEGAKLVMAVANAAVPKLTVMMGGSFGAGNYGMCGRAYQPRFLWTWPSARISVMGGEQAASVLSRLHFRSKNPTPQEVQNFEQPILDSFEKEGSAFFSTGHLWDDGILVPWETRQALALALSVTQQAPETPTSFGIFRM